MFTPQRSGPKPTLGGNGVFSMREMTSSSWGFSLSCWSFRGTSCEMYCLHLVLGRVCLRMELGAFAIRGEGIIMKIIKLREVRPPFHGARSGPGKPKYSPTSWIGTFRV